MKDMQAHNATNALIEELLGQGHARAIVVLALDTYGAMRASSKALVGDGYAHAWVLDLMRALERPMKHGKATANDPDATRRERKAGAMDAEGVLSISWWRATNIGDFGSVRVNFDDGVEMGAMAEPIDELPQQLEDLFRRAKEEVLRRAGFELRRPGLGQPIAAEWKLRHW